MLIQSQTKQMAECLKLTILLSFEIQNSTTNKSQILQCLQLLSNFNRIEAMICFIFFLHHLLGDQVKVLAFMSLKIICFLNVLTNESIIFRGLCRVEWPHHVFVQLGQGDADPGGASRLTNELVGCILRKQRMVSVYPFRYCTSSTAS